MSSEEKINKIEEILKEKNGISDSQEFGLTYGQILNYLEQIEDVIRNDKTMISREGIRWINYML